MKVYRTIVIIITAIVGVSITIMCLSGPHIQAAIYEPVTEEYYDLLKENALNVAKTLDKNVITDETLTANFYINKYPPVKRVVFL